MTAAESNNLASSLHALADAIKKQNGNSISLEEFHRLSLGMTDLLATLKERCPTQAKEIVANTQDIDAAFSRIRKIEHKLTGLLVLSSLITPVITAILINFFVGK